MGRPSKLTAEVIKTISDALYLGVSREMSARYAGITPQCFYLWLAEAKRLVESGAKKTKKNKLFFDFLTQIQSTEAEAVVKWQQVIDKAAERDPVWAFKMASIRDRSGYQSAEIAFTYDLSKATDVQLERIANGENPITVMADTGPSPAGTSQTQEPTADS
jgi:hypothetical protein